MLLMLVIIGGMVAWALVLAIWNGIQLTRPIATRNSGSGDFKSAFLLAGSGVLAVMSLALWIALIARDRRLRVGLKVVKVAAITIAVGTPVWAILDRDPHRAPWVAPIVLGAIGVSWTAHRAEQKRARTRKQPTSAASR
jgi:hypothetical protein